MKRMPGLWIVICIIFLLVSFTAAFNTDHDAGSVKVERTVHGVIFDIRDAEEYRVKHLQNAISVPMEKILCDSCLQDIMDAYEKNDTIIIYGGGKEEREMAREIFLQKGFEDVNILNGSIKELEREGYVLVSGERRGKEYSTGCISLDNYRVENKKLSLKAGSPPPPRWDWRHATYAGIKGDWTTPVKNQGNCGSCWDFAALGALESIINIRAHNPNLDFDLSEQYLLSCPSSSGGCSGWNAYWAYVYLYSHGGIIPENCFPYRANDGVPCSEKCSDWREKLLPVTEYGAMRTPDRETLKEMIVNFGPVVAEMAVYSDFGSYTGGIYEHPGEEPTSDINHQVVIVGYDDEQGCWICKNSWGSDWGENGWFRIAYGDCQIEHYIVYANFTPLVPVPGGPYYGRTGEEMEFDGSRSYTLLYPIVSYSWNFGDGSSGSGMKVKHVYLEEGKYTVRLTIRDEKGNEVTGKTDVYIDNTPPSIQVEKPKENMFYFFNTEKYNISFRTIIIGNITVLVRAEDAVAGMNKMELYLDGKLVEEGKDSIEWKWEHATFGFHTLQIKAYDMAGNVENRKIKVFTWMD